MNHESEWYILPATRDLFNKNKVTIEELRKEMGQGVSVLICIVQKFGTTSLAFVTSHGDCSEELNSKFIGVHDQTRSEIGYFSITAVLILGQTKEQDSFVGAEFNYDLNCPVYVCK